jgi:4a-hydroxytetrahydrobiopterin dehydratase
MKSLSFLSPASRSFLHLKRSVPARSFSSKTAAMAATPKFADGSDEPRLKKELEALLSNNNRWALTADGQGIERSFKFKTFAKTWVCMAVCRTKQ